MESFRLSQAIYGISDKNFQARLSHCLDIFEIHSKVDIPVRKLSLGERMKLELILAILHEPELLFLDEPTIGLDFNAATQIRKFLKEANKTLGITIVLTSHYTKDIEELCRRVIVINHGSLVYDGSLEGLDERIKGERILCLTTTSEASYKKIHAWSQEHPRTKFLPLDHDNPAEIRLSVPTDIATSVLTSLCASIDPHDLSDLVIEERSLEDVFAEIFARPSNRTVQKV